MKNSSNPDTISIHADKPHNQTKSLAPPIYQTSTFVAESAEDFLEMATTPQHSQFYSRYGNPNHAQTEAVIAELEGGERALLTASGMGAFSTVALALLEAGDHVIAQEVHYGGTIGFLEKLLSKFGVATTFVDQTDSAQFEAAIRPNTKLIVVETPTNPLMKLTDLRAIAEMARARHILTIADNTFATPINQQPLAYGIDLVFHSATKYLGGHHDLVAGALAGSEALIQQIWHTAIKVGASLNAFDSWLLLRGLRTLALRVERHNQNALQVAQALESHPKVKAVYYPGLTAHPQRELARSQMKGYTGMMSIELRGGLAATERFISNLRLVERAASLGGVHSLVAHPAAMLAAVLSEEEFRQRGISPGLTRLSVGLENADDLIADIMSALESV